MVIYGIVTDAWLEEEVFYINIPWLSRSFALQNRFFVVFLQSWCSSWLLLLGLFFCPRESGFIGILSQCLGYLVFCGGMSFLTPLESSTHRLLLSYFFVLKFTLLISYFFVLKFTLFFVSSSGGLSYCVDDVNIVITLFCLNIYSVVACSVHVILLFFTFLVEQKIFVLKYK